MTAPRYFAAIAQDRPLPQHYASQPDPALNRVDLGETVSLWTTDHLIKIGDRGAIIGHLFTRSVPSRRISMLDRETARRIVETGIDSLTTNFWGNYVVFLRDADNNITIIRDPLGGLPAYWREDKGVILIAPEVGAYPFRAIDGVTVEFSALAVHLWDVHAAGQRTCLKGVNELLPGHALRVGQCITSVRSIWMPWQYARKAKTAPFPDPSALTATILDVISAWSGCFDTVALGISGGLDSSIVSAGLARADGAIRLYNMAWSDPEGDERNAAQLVADEYGADLEIFHYDRRDVNICAPNVPGTARPFLAPYIQSIAKAHDKILETSSVDAMMDGDGGDAVFCLMQSVTPIIDRIASRASLSAIWTTAKDLASVTNSDIFRISRYLAARMFKYPSRQSYPGDDTFLSREQIDHGLSAVDSHPWRARQVDLLPGSQAHIWMIRRALGNDGFHSRRTHPPLISPLLSQPVVEMCLAFPSWEWIAGGIDRSVIRRALTDVLPAAIVKRRSKGGPSGFLNHLYWLNESKILAHLRSGVLAEAGVLDREKLDQIGRNRNAIAPGTPRRLLSLVSAESWARHWMPA